MSLDRLEFRLTPEELGQIIDALHRDCECCEPEAAAQASRFTCEPLVDDTP
jgi:hypothetical protein